MTPGDIVAHAKFGQDRWIVRHLRDDGLVDLVARITIGGRVVYRGFPATPGDLTLIEPAPSYSPGFVLQRNGVEHTVIEDLGDAVLFEVGESHKELRGRGRLKVAGGNSVRISKFDLAIENLTGD